MTQGFQKSDRVARLLKLQLLLWQQHHGMDVSEMARLCSVSKRTIYRDLITLEAELKVPIWEEGTRRGIVDGYFLPPITFTQEEAVNIFLAARLMQNYSYVYNPSLLATFIKLNAILPSHLREQINNTLNYLESLPRDENKIRNFSRISEAWLSRHRITFKYRELDTQEPVEFIVDPYFIEPSMLGMSSYLIAYCSQNKIIRGFKIDHIVDDVSINPETYEIPASFDVNDYVGSPWDIFTGDKLKSPGNIRTVKLRFNAKIARQVMETLWHPSQQTETGEDGTMIMTLRVRNTLSFRTWIMRWEKWVEVLEPGSLRKQIARMVHDLDVMYSDTQPKHRDAIDMSNLKKTKTPHIFTGITDDQWKQIGPLLPESARTGRPRLDDRQIINGIFYVLKNKIRWSDLPASYGAATTCNSRYMVWKKTGIWDKIQSVVKS
jgi:predicted DNA-binding transcriptional regulator YafY